LFFFFGGSTLLGLALGFLSGANSLCLNRLVLREGRLAR